MRILHILEATRGGTRRHILDLLPALRARGVHCTLAASSMRGPEFGADAELLRAAGVEVLDVPMARGVGARVDAAALHGLGALLRARPFDLIHCHSTKAGMLGRLARLWAAPAVPLVYTPHCIAFDTGLPHAQRRAARTVEKLLARWTTHYIAVSRRERHAILSRALCRPEQVTTIYNGINLREFDALPARQRSEFGLGEGDFVIGCFGRLTRQKNQAALLHALPLIRQRIPGAAVLLVGGGEDEAALRRLAARLRIASRVAWAGDQREARPLYALCDVIAQPSRWEGCPYSLLEAMAARRPIAAQAAGGVEEILTADCGVTWRRQARPEHIALAANVVRLAGQSPGSFEWREARRHAARTRVEEKFLLDRMVDETMAVYRATLARPAS